MNSYDYDYMNYMNNIPNNSYLNDLMPNYAMNNINATNYNPMNNSSQMKLLNSNGNILEPYQGFIRGNLFNNLYDGYKNYKPMEVNPTNEREALLEQWQQYNFTLTDLNLFLDLYPDNKEAVNLYNKYLKMANQIKDKYESTYGPICLDSNNVGKDKWKWINGPWPWEGVK